MDSALSPVSRDHATELAWAAGFFDGEGSTSVDRGTGKAYGYLRLSVAQSSDSGPPSTLVRFHGIVGGKINGPYTTQRPDGFTRKPRYILVVYQEVAERALALMWPYLGVEKRAQADAARSTVAGIREARAA